MSLRGEHAEALDRYKDLASLYPDNYWAAESLYRIVLLAGQAHDERAVADAYKQLLRGFPENNWTLKAIKEFGAER